MDKQQKELEGLQQNRREHEQAGRTKEGEQRQNDIAKKHSDLSARANASESFASWQKKMENLQVRAGKRNIVNTYVWDGDGGFHAEEQQFASTVEHTVGGSFDMGFAIGGEGAFAVGGVAVGLTAMAKVSMTQTMNKTERGRKGLELHVDSFHRRASSAPIARAAASAERAAQQSLAGAPPRDLCRAPGADGLWPQCGQERRSC